MDLKKIVHAVMSDSVKRSDRMLKEAEKRAKSEGRTLNDKYYQNRERVDELKRKGLG